MSCQNVRIAFSNRLAMNLSVLDELTTFKLKKAIIIIIIIIIIIVIIIIIIIIIIVIIILLLLLVLLIYGILVMVQLFQLVTYFDWPN